MNVLYLIAMFSILSQVNSLLSNAVKIIRPSLPKETSEVREELAVEMLQALQQRELIVPSYISTSPISGTFVQYPSHSSKTLFSASKTPVVLLHGFDSSCLEFRRLAPLLNDARNVYVPDILGWGFNDHSNVSSFSPDAKLDYLRCFLEQVVKRECILVGASLGGAIAILLAAKYPTLVKKVVLIDAQGFIDGTGKPSDLPDFFAKLGVDVLKSIPLRMYANLISYTDKKLASWDAMRIGRLHCFTDTWERASISFVKSGGFVVSDKVSKVQQKTLVIWGNDDKILDISNAMKFKQILPTSDVKVLNSCGHVPHLEKPLETAELIKAFANDV